MNLESSLQQQVIKYINSKDIYCFKTVTNNRRGIPDIIVCYKGQFISLELKSSKGKLSMLQKLELQRIKNAGGFYLLVIDLPTFISDFNYIINCIDMNRISNIRKDYYYYEYM